MKQEKIAYYNGKKVIVTCSRRVPGGIACDVKKHPDNDSWPYMLSSWTTCSTNLTSDREGKDMFLDFH